jgi:hypothetical protein
MHDPSSSNQSTRRSWIKLLLLILAAASLLAFLEFFKAPEKGFLWIWALDAGHWPLFGVFALVVLGIVGVLTGGSRIPRLAQYALAFVVTGGFCVLTEVVQYFGPRDADFGDLARGLSGALAFLLLRLTFDHDGLRAVALGRNPLRIALVLAAIGLFWVSCGPLFKLARAYSMRAEAFPQLCNFQSSWEDPFHGTRDAELAIIGPPDEWSGESEDNLVGRITFLPATFPAFFLQEVVPDWSEYDRLCFVVFTKLEAPVELILRLNDQRHDNAFDDRFNRSLIIHPGINHICVELDEVREAPKGREMNLSQMHNLALFTVNPEEEFSVYVDSFRLEKD